MADDEGFAPGVDEDLGEPIAELQGYAEEGVEGLFGRITRSLGRRTLGSHIATFSWIAMGEVVLEFLKMIHSMFQSGRTDQGE